MSATAALDARMGHFARLVGEVPIPAHGGPVPEGVEIPADATRVSICSCGASAWSTGDGSEDDELWFADFNSAHADCDADDSAEHYEPGRPAYGYVADDRDFFARALTAKDQAEGDRGFSARWLADNAVKNKRFDEYDAVRYRQDVAAHEYARAVYEVEAAKVRAS